MALVASPGGYNLPSPLQTRSQPRRSQTASSFSRENSVITPRPGVKWAYNPYLEDSPVLHQPQALYVVRATNPPPPTKANPIKAWCGYGGNIYFEPVNFTRARILPRTAPPGGRPIPTHTPERTIRHWLKPYPFKPDREQQGGRAVFDPIVLSRIQDVVDTQLGKNRKWMDGVNALGSLTDKPLTDRSRNPRRTQGRKPPVLRRRALASSDTRRHSSIMPTPRNEETPDIIGHQPLTSSIQVQSSP